MLIAAQSTGIKAALNFAGAAMVWEKSELVSAWLKGLAAKAKIPVYFIQAENDFSVKPTVELSAEMKKAGKPFQMKIYPPNGKTAMDGHTFIDATAVWGPDIFPWLAETMKEQN